MRLLFLAVTLAVTATVALTQAVSGPDASATIPNAPTGLPQPDPSRVQPANQSGHHGHGHGHHHGNHSGNEGQQHQHHHGHGRPHGGPDGPQLTAAAEQTGAGDSAKPHGHHHHGGHRSAGHEHNGTHHGHGHHNGTHFGHHNGTHFGHHNGTQQRKLSDQEREQMKRGFFSFLHNVFGGNATGAGGHHFFGGNGTGAGGHHLLAVLGGNATGAGGHLQAILPFLHNIFSGLANKTSDPAALISSFSTKTRSALTGKTERDGGDSHSHHSRPQYQSNNNNNNQQMMQNL
ncbi:uncharacterized protein LOC129596476 isoform X2 [Paramacrobiotus metropolitanus]|nr:uncharacterized protein LOC129596476 isoform X2 [Paramacrobiotus metropolitanus]